jgi:hypothetical protein
MAVSRPQTLKPLKPPESGFYGYVYRFCCRNANNHGDNERFTVHKTSETGPAIILVNGMRHRQAEIELNLAMAKLAMHQVDSTVISINNITNGFFKDLFRSTVLYLGGTSDASRSLCNVLQTKLNQNKPVLIHCHSEGALVVKAALYQLARQNKAKFKELYPKLKIFSYGGASLFDEKFAPYVKNHISILDPIPLILRPFAIFKYIWAAILLKKRKVEKNPERTVTIGNVQFHPCLSQNPFKEHSFRGSTYTDPFFHELYNSNLKNWKFAK